MGEHNVVIYWNKPYFLVLWCLHAIMFFMVKCTHCENKLTYDRLPQNIVFLIKLIFYSLNFSTIKLNQNIKSTHLDMLNVSKWVNLMIHSHTKCSLDCTIKLWSEVLYCLRSEPISQIFLQSWLDAWGKDSV